MREAELAWVRGLVAEFEDGTFPGLDGWRTCRPRMPASSTRPARDVADRQAGARSARREEPPD